MNNTTSSIIYTLIAILFTLGLLGTGVYYENHRIYGKCLEQFGQMPYTHVRTACEELTK
jgi:hypothetical protein